MMTDLMKLRDLVATLTKMLEADPEAEVRCCVELVDEEDDHAIDVAHDKDANLVEIFVNVVED